jgi:hypothetical protein
VSSRYLSANYTDVYDEAELKDGVGMHLGDRLHVPTVGEFVLTEAAGDLTRGMILVRKILLAIDDVTLDTTALTLNKDPGQTVAVGRLAGLQCHFDDNGNNTGEVVILKGNDAGVNGTAFNIYLQAAITTPGALNDITVIDPNYVEKSLYDNDAGDDLQRIIGVCHVTVDQSVKPYFWRQVSGVAPVLCAAAVAVDRRLAAGDATAGTAIEAVLTATDDQAFFARVLSPAPAADTLCLCELEGVLS